MDDGTRIGAILHFWFGELDADGMAAAGRNKLWFQSDRDNDRQIAEVFGADVAQAVAGNLDHWAEQQDGVIALVLLLDQFTRNIHRGTEAAFSGDPKALELARAAVSDGLDLAMPTIHRVFLYVPFEHAEDLEAQELGISCFERLLDYCSEDARQVVAGFRDYAVAHRDVIVRFGRFPHRNEVLGRKSSTEELSHLHLHGGF